MGIDIRELKKSLRAECKEFRRLLPFAEKLKKDEEIFKRLTALPEYQEAGLVLTYVSTPIEVSTFRLITAALAAGKRVAAPRCAEGRIAMDFYEIRSMDDLEKAAFSVLEPKLDRCEKIRDFSGSVCIIPGLAFDPEGYRLGYGKGYYDRFLNGYDGYHIGICYNGCMKNRLPHGRYDVSVDVLVTEKFVKRIARPSKRNGGRPVRRQTLRGKKR